MLGKKITQCKLFKRNFNKSKLYSGGEKGWRTSKYNIYLGFLNRQYGKKATTISQLFLQYETDFFSATFF